MNSPAGAPKKPKDTDVWPIQSFQWKDVFAPRVDRFRYHIYIVRGTAKKPVRDQVPLMTTPFAHSTNTWGRSAWCSIGDSFQRKP